MPAKTASVPTTAARPTRLRRAAATTITTTTTADPDALANDLDRVLKVSQPQAKAPTKPSTTTTTAPTGRRTVSATKAAAAAAALATKPAASRTTAAPTRSARTATTTTTTTTATARAPAAGGKVISDPPASTTARGARVRTTSATAAAVPSTSAIKSKATASSSKAKAKAAAPESEPALGVSAPDLPWVNAGGANAMSARERAQAAQLASNDALRVLSEALKAGFKYSSAAPKSTPSPPPTSTHAQVDDALRLGLAAVNVLRELYAGPKTGPQRLAVERGAFNIVFKCVCMEMVSETSPRSPLTSSTNKLSQLSLPPNHM